MGRFILILLLIGSVCGLVGCSHDEPADPNRVSTIPWNRPERWESQGPMGGMMNTQQGY
jgi:hypothetical protein